MSNLRREPCQGEHHHVWLLDEDPETGETYEFCMIDEYDPVKCPECGAVNPVIETGSAPGFTGALIYFANFKCCGHQEVDASGDNLGVAE
jgi:hypothetical protein